MRLRVGVGLLVGALSVALSAATERAPAPLPPSGVALGDWIACVGRRTTLISAHRGGVEPGFPENALETFANTLGRAPMLLEVDVRSTRDRVLALMHDASLDRTTTGQGPINAVSWAELQGLRLEDNDGVATPFAPPSLAQALEWARERGVLLLDVKEDSAVEGMVEAVRAADAVHRTGLIVYSPEQAVRARRVEPGLTLFYPAEDAAPLLALQQRGVALEKLVVFAGIERQNATAWRRIEALGPPIAFGTLFLTDPVIAATGEDRHYAWLSRQGVDVLPTDRHHAAFRAIDAVRPVHPALRACGPPRG